MAGPLKDIKVLDLSRVLAGPWASQILADMGAEVVKVERPGAGDDTRAYGPPFLKDQDGNDTMESGFYLCTNRAKRSIAIDFRAEEGQAIIKKMAGDADIILENFKTGGLAKYGLDYESLSKVNPNVIYCSVTGFGQDGPRAHEAGYDFMIQGMSGLMSFTGTPESGPMKVGTAVADLTTGMYSAIAILGALHHRTMTGQGQHIDMALLDVQTSWLANQAMNFLISGEQPIRRGNAHPNIVPYQDFEAKDGHVIIAVGNGRQYARFCNLMGRPDLIEPYKTNRMRVEKRDELIPIIKEEVKKKTCAEWLELLDKENIPAGPINTLAETFAEPQIVYRKVLRYLKHPVLGVDVPQIATPIKYSKTKLEYKDPPPMIGQHTDEIMAELGYLENEIQALKDKEIIA